MFGDILLVLFNPIIEVYTLPETNSSHLKMDGWKTTFLLGTPIFRGYVSFRKGNYIIWYHVQTFFGCRETVKFWIRHQLPRD